MLDALTQRLSNVEDPARPRAAHRGQRPGDVARGAPGAPRCGRGPAGGADFVAAVKDEALGQEMLGSLTRDRRSWGRAPGAGEPHGRRGPGPDFATQPPTVSSRACRARARPPRRRLARSSATPRRRRFAGLHRRLSSGGDRAAGDPRETSIDLFPRIRRRSPSTSRAPRSTGDEALPRRPDRRHRGAPGRRRGDDARVRELHAAMKPIETLFMVDSMQGQDAVNVARAFNEALPITGTCSPSSMAIRAAAPRSRCGT